MLKPIVALIGLVVGGSVIYGGHHLLTHPDQKSLLRQQILRQAASPATTMDQQNDLIVKAHDKGLLPDLMAEYDFLMAHHPEKPYYQSAYAACFYVGHAAIYNPQGGGWLRTDFDKAWEAAQRSVQGAGAKIPYCWVNYGRFCMDLKNDPAAAEQAYKKAVALSPTFAYAHVMLGDLYTTPGPYCFPKKALHESQIALSLKPDYGAAYGTACYAYLAMNDGKNAYESYKHGLDITPGAYKDPEALKFLAGLKSIADKQAGQKK